MTKPLDQNVFEILWNLEDARDQAMRLLECWTENKVMTDDPMMQEIHDYSNAENLKKIDQLDEQIEAVECTLADMDCPQPL